MDSCEQMNPKWYHTPHNSASGLRTLATKISSRDKMAWWFVEPLYQQDRKIADIWDWWILWAVELLNMLFKKKKLFWDVVVWGSRARLLLHRSLCMVCWVLLARWRHLPESYAFFVLKAAHKARTSHGSSIKLGWWKNANLKMPLKVSSL